jgi:beta-lactamase regulating signal transducer with metallopeptidase domain
MIFRNGDFLAGAVLALLLRATLILLTGWLITRVLRRARPSVRHSVWIVTLAGALVSAVAGLWLGGWESAPEPARIVTGHVAALPINGRIGTVCIALWLAGVVVTVLRLASAVHAVTKLARTARPLAEAAWLHSLEHAAARTGVSRAVDLRCSDELAVPITWGVRRPVIIVPCDAGEWSEARRSAVLLHELAHIRRADCAHDLFARTTAALLWFHPGVWLVAQQARLERELECDLVVVEHGTDRTEYAEHLLEILRAALRPRAVWAGAGLPMIGRSQLEIRLHALATVPAVRVSRSAHAWLLLLLVAAATLSFYTPDLVPARPVVHAVPVAPKPKCKCAPKAVPKPQPARAA